jgi:hypothetical protein
MKVINKVFKFKKDADEFDIPKMYKVLFQLIESGKMEYF